MSLTELLESFVSEMDAHNVAAATSNSVAGLRVTLQCKTLHKTVTSRNQLGSTYTPLRN